MIIESAIFTVPALTYFGLLGNVEQIYTFGFAYLNLTGVFTLMIVRERRHFWNSKPSRFLSITVLMEVLFVIAISIFGVLELAPLGILPVLAIIGYALLTTFIINDLVKVYLTRKFKTD
jgi:H+-transporting ATPase